MFFGKDTKRTKLLGGVYAKLEDYLFKIGLKILLVFAVPTLIS